MSGVPTPEEVASHEAYQSIVRGWTDGAAGRSKDPKFTEHKTRADLTAHYLEGYDRGVEVRIGMTADAARRVGHVPSVLR